MSAVLLLLLALFPSLSFLLIRGNQLTHISRRRGRWLFFGSGCVCVAGGRKGESRRSRSRERESRRRSKLTLD